MSRLDVHAHGPRRGWRGLGTLAAEQAIFFGKNPSLFRELALPLAQRFLAPLHFRRPPRDLFHGLAARGFSPPELLFVARGSLSDRPRTGRGRLGTAIRVGGCGRRTRP